MTDHPRVTLNELRATVPQTRALAILPMARSGYFCGSRCYDDRRLDNLRAHTRVGNLANGSKSHLATTYNEVRDYVSNEWLIRSSNFNVNGYSRGYSRWSFPGARLIR
jgi:hypothetical protein